jgi:hypothetical protein
MPMDAESVVINEVGDFGQRLAPPTFEHCFEGHAVRSVVRDGQPWFVAADVCAVMEHTNPSMALSRLDADEMKLPRFRGVVIDLVISVLR